jgi:hypothetical protein
LATSSPQQFLFRDAFSSMDGDAIQPTLALPLGDESGGALAIPTDVFGDSARRELPPRRCEVKRDERSGRAERLSDRFRALERGAELGSAHAW